MKYCTHCGKEIVDEAVICLNCGCVTGQPNAYNAVPTTKVIVEDREPQLAVWAKICGIVSFFFGWLALGITAIVLANISKEDTEGKMCSSAKVGYVCGIISTVLSSLVLVFYIILVISLMI